MAEIRNRITLEGAGDVQSSLDRIAQAWQSLVQKIQAGGRQTGLDQTQRQTEAVGRAFEQAGKQAQVFGAQAGQGFAEARAGADNAATGLDGLLRRLGEVSVKAGLAIGAIGAAAAAITQSLVSGAVESTDAIGKNAEALGLSVRAYQQLAFTADKVGVSNDALVKGFGTLSDAIDTVLQSANKFGTFSGQQGFDRFATGVGVLGFSAGADTADADRESAARKRELAAAVQNAEERYADLVRQQEAAANGASRADIAQDRLNVRFREAAEAVDDARAKYADFAKAQAASAAAKPPELNLKDQAAKANELRAAFRELNIDLFAFTQATEDASNAEDDEAESDAVATRQAREKEQVFRDVIARLRDMPESTKKARLETLLFGSAAKDLAPILTLTSKQLEAYRAEFDATGRGLTEDDVANVRAYTAAQANLQGSLKATRDQLGLLFVPGRTAAANFFASIVDGIRAPILQFAAAGVAFTRAFTGNPEVRQRFLDGLRFIGETLANMGRIALAVVAPAFRLVESAVLAAARGLSQLAGQDVSASLVVAAAAVLRLGSALGLFTTLTAPVVGVLTTIVAAIAGLGPVAAIAGLAVVAFWDDISDAAGKALDVILEHTDEVRVALRQIGEGDFRGAFETLKVAASSALDEVIKRVPGVATAIKTVRETFKELRESFLGAFGTLRDILSGAATYINALFGTNFTDKSLAATVAVLYFTNSLSSLAAVGVLAAAAIRAIGLPLSALLFGLGALKNLGIERVIEGIAGAFQALFTDDMPKALEKLRAAWAEFWKNVADGGVHTWLVIGAGALGLLSVIRSITGIVGISAGGAFFGLLAVPLVIDLIRRGFINILTTVALVADGIRKQFSGDILGGLRQMIGAIQFAIREALGADGKTWVEVIAAVVLVLATLRKIIPAGLGLALGGAEAGAAASAAGKAVGLLFRGALIAALTFELTALIAEKLKALGLGPKLTQEQAINDLIQEGKRRNRTPQQQQDDAAAQRQSDKAKAAAAGAATDFTSREVDTEAIVLKDLFDRAGEAFREVTNRALPDFGTAAQETGTKASKGLEKVVETAKTVNDAVEGAVDNVKVYTEKNLSELAKAADGQKEKVGGTFSDFVKALFGGDGFDAALKTFQGQVRDFSGSTKSAVDAGADAMRSASDDAKDYLEELKGTASNAGKALDDLFTTKTGAGRTGGGAKRITLPQQKDAGTGGFEGFDLTAGAGESATIAKSQVAKASDEVDSLIDKVSGSLSLAFDGAARSLETGLAAAEGLVDRMIEKAGQLRDALAPQAGQAAPAPTAASDATGRIGDVTQAFGDLRAKADTAIGDTQARLERLKPVLDDIDRTLKDAASQDLSKAIPDKGAFGADGLRPSTNIEDRRPETRTQTIAAQEEATQALATVQQIADQIAGQIADAFDGAVLRIGGTISLIPQLFADAFGEAAGRALESLFAIENEITKLVAMLQQIKAPTLAPTPAAPSGGEPQTFADGGMPGGLLRGPGTPTSDSILAKVSTDEFITRAKAVRHYGADIFYALNRMAVPADALRALLGLGGARFAQGGLVGALPTLALPRFADGGLVAAQAPAVPSVAQALHPVTFVIGDTKVQARMTPDDYEAAHRAFLARRNVRKA
ncbi:MAG: hypothetical protein U1E62_05470 [Alsobacter sp.]